jgi:hypothetical protein
MSRQDLDFEESQLAAWNQLSMPDEVVFEHYCTPYVRDKMYGIIVQAGLV